MKCGEFAETDACCKEGAEKCDCGMNKGAPMCCKLKKDEDKDEDADQPQDG